jgi:flagellar basal-body rod protein FlgB
MDQVYLFGIASQRSSWLANRQTVVAENVANASTPGYTSKDISSFTEVLDTTGMEISRSSDMHLASLGRSRGENTTAAQTSWDVTHSGNSVIIEQEMLKAGEISRSYALNTSVMKAFQRLLIMSVKG